MMAIPYTLAMNHSNLESTAAQLPLGYRQRPALLLHKLGNTVLERAEGPMAAIGLTPRQYSLLAVMDSDEPQSQLQLAGLCGLLPAQVVPVLDELEARGLVERTRSDTDRRRSVVRITDSGRELLRRADALGESIMDGLFPHLDAEAREQLDETVRAALERAFAG
jgi:DNA-binding MarR family transcriptional regulator